MDDFEYLPMDKIVELQSKGIITSDNKIEVKFLTKGMYLLKLENFEIIKFIKE